MFTILVKKRCQVNEGDLVAAIIDKGAAKIKEVAPELDSDGGNEAPDVDLEDKNCAEVSPEVTIGEHNIKEIIDRVTSNITGTLQTLIVSDRVVAAEQNTNDWKRLCQLMANNPEIINNKMLLNDNPSNALRQIGPDFTNITKVKESQILTSTNILMYFLIQLKL